MRCKRVLHKMEMPAPHALVLFPHTRTFLLYGKTQTPASPYSSKPDRNTPNSLAKFRGDAEKKVQAHCGSAYVLADFHEGDSLIQIKSVMEPAIAKLCLRWVLSAMCQMTPHIHDRSGWCRLHTVAIV